jgi:hypothetical protein
MIAIRSQSLLIPANPILPSRGEVGIDSCMHLLFEMPNILELPDSGPFGNIQPELTYFSLPVILGPLDERSGFYVSDV